MSKIDPKVVREHFDWRSEEYSNLFDTTTRTGSAYNFQTRQKITAEIASKHGGRMLDCASGTGEVTLATLKCGTFESATINDYSPKMLAHSEKLISSRVDVPVEFINEDVFDLNHELIGQKFDLILCVGLLAHVGKLEQLLCELRNLVADQGTILLQNTSLDHMGIKITKMLSEKRHIKNHGYAIRHYPHRQIEIAADKADLVIRDRSCFGLNIPFLDRITPGMNYRIEKGMSKLGNQLGAESIYTLTPVKVKSKKRQESPARVVS